MLYLNDPPDSEERRRNNVVEDLQGTRNLFIDQSGFGNQL